MNAQPDRGPSRNEMPVVLDARVVCGTGGGPEKTILNSPRLLEPMGYRNLCAYMHSPDDPGFETLRRKAALWGAPLLSVPDRGPLDWRVFSQLLKICRQERVAIWHGHDYKSDLLGLILRRFWPMRLVTTVHGWGVMGSRRIPLYNRIDRLCLPQYETVICVSADLRQLCLNCGVADDRCVLIENAIDTQQYTRKATRDEAKQRLGIDADRHVIGAVGRLSGEKGFDFLVMAADRLLKEGFNIELLIVGEGDERPRLEALIARLGRGDRIRLLGFRPDTTEVYEAMDVYALSSLSEGLPNVVLEAMAMEVPIVATCVGAIPQIIRHEENGLIIEPRSHDELAGALGRILRNDDLRFGLGQAGHKCIGTKYGFIARMEKVRAIYDNLLGRKPEPETAHQTMAIA